MGQNKDGQPETRVFRDSSEAPLSLLSGHVGALKPLDTKLDTN